MVVERDLSVGWLMTAEASGSWGFWEREFAQNDIYRREWSDWDQLVDRFQATSTIESRLVYGQHDDRAVTSIIIPAYRRPEGLQRALASALGQDFAQPYEVVVVDDSGASAVDHQAIDSLMHAVCAQHDNVVYYRNEENLGANDNWNRTMELCRTPWFCMLHDDDELYPNYLTEMYGRVPVLDDRDVALVSPYYALVTEKAGAPQSALTVAFGRLLAVRQNRPIVLDIRDALHSMFPNSVAMFINRQKAVSVGGLNRKWGVLADSVFFAQLGKQYKTGIYPKALCRSNKMGDSASTSPVVAVYVVMSYFQRTKAIAKTLGKTDRACQRLASESTVFAELALLNKSVEEINRTRTILGVSPVYNRAWYKQVLRLKKILLWARLLLRR